jgi:hypothetical protein
MNKVARHYGTYKLDTGGHPICVDTSVSSSPIPSSINKSIRQLVRHELEIAL